jgi:hypothetical protein
MTLSKQELFTVLSHYGANPKKAAVLFVRGGSDGQNDYNKYDDECFVWTGTDEVKRYLANCDPTSSSTSKAQLVTENVYYFSPGKHHILSPAPRGYAAFRQYGDYVYSRIRQGRFRGNVGINMHRGGEYTTSSLGCLTIRPEDWAEFRDSLYSVLNCSMTDEGLRECEPKNNFPVLILTAAQVREALAEKKLTAVCKGKPVAVTMVGTDIYVAVRDVVVALGREKDLVWDAPTGVLTLAGKVVETNIIGSRGYADVHTVCGVLGLSPTRDEKDNSIVVLA